MNKLAIKKEKSLWSEIKSILLLVSIALIIRVFILELFYVPTGSMKATILEGDYIFSTKYSYGYSNYSIPFSPDIIEKRILSTLPTRGDVVIMRTPHRPPHNMEMRYVKRLIGMPGDKIEIIDDVTYINDKQVQRVEMKSVTAENRMEFRKFKETLPNGVEFYSYKKKYSSSRFDHSKSNFEAYYVPENEYFMMGDNRDQSGDSRYQLGTVPFENFIAKGRFVIFSAAIPLWDGSLGFIDQITKIWDWLKSIRFTRTFKNLYSVDSDE